MQLKGSCHCGAVKFSLRSDPPVPFTHCDCSVCRKTAGSGGYAINLGGDASTTAAVGQLRTFAEDIQSSDSRHCLLC